MGMDGVTDVLEGKFLKPPLTSSRSPLDSSRILLLMSVSRFVWEGAIPSPSKVTGVCGAVRLRRDPSHNPKQGQKRASIDGLARPVSSLPERRSICLPERNAAKGGPRWAVNQIPLDCHAYASHMAGDGNAATYPHSRMAADENLRTVASKNHQHSQNSRAPDGICCKIEPKHFVGCWVQRQIGNDPSNEVIDKRLGDEHQKRGYGTGKCSSCQTSYCSE
jgi:hypothetical protein